MARVSAVPMPAGPVLSMLVPATLSVIVLGTLSVLSAPRPASAQEMTPSLRSGLAVTVGTPGGTIDDLRDGSFAVSLSNDTGDTVTVESLAASTELLGAIAEISFSVVGGCEPAGAATTTPCTIPADGQAVFGVGVDVRQVTRPGSSLLPLAITVSADDRETVLRPIATLTVGVFGEADLAKVLQVPVLLLPGGLLLGLVALMWTSFGWRPLGAAPTFPLGGVQLAIATLGLTAAYVAMAAVVQRRNLLRGYGYGDLLTMALVAVGLALAAGLWLLRVRNRQTAAAAAISDRRLRASDTPEAALRRWATVPPDTTLQRPTVTIGGRRLIVHHPATADEPGIAGSVLVYDSEDDEVLEQLIALRNDGRLAPLATALSALLAEPTGRVTVRWRDTAPVGLPAGATPVTDHPVDIIEAAE